MRLLVLFLVVANLAFYFLYPRPPATSGLTGHNPPGVPGSERLVLLAERPVVTVTEVELLSSTGTRGTELTTQIAEDYQPDRLPAVLAEAPVEAVLDHNTQDVEQVVVGESGEVVEPASEDMQLGIAEFSAEPEQETGAAIQVPVAGDVGNAVESAGLVAEVPQSAVVETALDSGDPTDTVEGVTVQEVVSKVVPDPVCYSIGPFLPEGEASAVAKQLQDNGYQVSERVDTIQEPKDYWVYLSAMPKDEARRVVADLKARGIKDYFVGKQHYISLGIFSRKSQALRRQKQIAGLGYDAVLDRRFRDRSVRWLDVRDEENTLGGSGNWASIQEKYPDATSKPASCE